jgi:hypothetical protein
MGPFRGRCPKKKEAIQDLFKTNNILQQCVVITKMKFSDIFACFRVKRSEVVDPSRHMLSDPNYQHFSEFSRDSPPTGIPLTTQSHMASNVPRRRYVSTDAHSTASFLDVAPRRPQYKSLRSRNQSADHPPPRNFRDLSTPRNSSRTSRFGSNVRGLSNNFSAPARSPRRGHRFV